MHRSATIFLALILLAIPAFAQEAGTLINVINMDGVGEGFNDPTPVAPIGGNPGTTLGEQRLIAFQYAADLWATLIDSPVEIRVEANFNPLDCSSESAVLGSAGPRSVFSGFSGQPIADTWYVSALANKLAGTDLEADDPEIQARFNSSLNGDPNCGGGSSWYYGLDNNPSGDQIDLVVVVLHELGHGLGFLTTTDKESGDFLQGRPDIYARFLYDNTLGASWPQMTAAQRAASAVSVDNLVWIGENAVTAAPSFLDGTSILEVTEPDSVEGIYRIGLASFGGEITVAGVSSRVVAAEDPADTAGPSATDACSTILNPSEIAGNIALIDRGDCTFVTKALNAQAAGAIGVIIVNNEFGAAPGMSGDNDAVTIPVISVSQLDGGNIRNALGSPVRATIRVDPQELAGADPLGRPKMYAPNPVETGSSVSHWDTSAQPNLLMEPNISSSLGHGIDLSRDLFADIGWYSDAILEAFLRYYVMIDRDRDGAADPGDTLRLIASIQNNGGSSARDVVFDLPLPDGLTVVPGSVEGGEVTETDGRLTVEVGTVVVGEESTLTFDLLVDPLLPGTSDSFELQAAILSNIEATVTDDPATVASDDPTIVEIAHTALRAFKTVQLLSDQNETGLSGGDHLRYYILVTNNSGSTLSNVTVTDPIDSSLEIVPGSVAIGAGSQNGTVIEGNGSGDRRVVVSFDSLGAGASVEIGFDVEVDSNVSRERGLISNQAEVEAEGVVVVTDDPGTRDLHDPTSIQFPTPRKRPVRLR